MAALPGAHRWPAPDLPGFGESAKPAAFDYSIGGLSGWLKGFLADRGVDRYSLVAHDWGALRWRWPRPSPSAWSTWCCSTPSVAARLRVAELARQWRRPLIGEMAMGFTFKFVTRRLLRLPDGSDFPEHELDDIWTTSTTAPNARSCACTAPPRRARASRRAPASATATFPSLVVWGDTDPYLPVQFAHDYAAALGGPAEVEIVEGAGHWPWIDRPEVVDRVAAFLA